MLKSLSVNDCKNILRYYNINNQSCIKKMKYKASELLVNRICKCYSVESYVNTKFQNIIHKRYYNSRNYKNLNITKKILLF